MQIMHYPNSEQDRSDSFMRGQPEVHIIYGEFTNTFTIPRSPIDDLNVLLELMQ